MSIIDIVLAALILFGIISGFMKGLFVEVASIVALIAGVYGAIHFSNFAAEYLNEKVEWDEKTVNVTAFIITFVIIVLAIALAGKALTKLADFAALGILNRILGALFGGLKIALVLSVLLLIVERTNNTLSFLDEEDIDESVLYKPVKALVPAILPIIVIDKNASEETLEKEVI